MSAHKISETLWTFSDEKGRKLEAVRGERNDDSSARLEHKRTTDNPTYPDFGYKWYIYEGEQFLGVYNGPKEAAEIYSSKGATNGRILS